VDESFVNHTNETLEGVFQFPLPQDASISGFGMWIGDQLVEADVVEKQRAREIYETIKRERRDPGLLEWAGGSLFKARVFPIPPRAEKRITLTYTQVLPLRGGQWRYDYALRSDLLRAHPVRELVIDVRIHSEASLRAVECPSHPAQVERTEHGARVRFEAQEVRPDRDFRVVVAPETPASGITFATHRRGDDGYFLVLFQPPAPAAVPAAGGPSGPAGLRLLVLADTSGSMSTAARAAQDAFLRALLGSLATGDRFRLAACDVSCAWAQEGLTAATEASVEAALGFLAARESLGWTDIDAVVDAAAAAAEPGTHVVYVGDGRHSAGDADLGAATARIAARRIGVASFHAVAPGNLVEPPVMQALASLGQGSFRILGDADAPRGVARELLAELLEPGPRDLRVEIQGMDTAAVYPETLPGLARGTQQVIVGRFRPGDGGGKAVVVIRGRDTTGEQEWRRDLSLADADRGNAFIPRLWARHHLDRLLRESPDGDLRDRVVAFSQEYRILTPYTSFLVLETDADRERFGVQRHVRMRDGEDFFTEGRARAEEELARKAMRAAGTWRARLRQAVLASMAGMGRDLPLVQTFWRGAGWLGGLEGRMDFGAGGGGLVGGDVSRMSATGKSDAWNGLNGDMLLAPDAAGGPLLESSIENARRESEAQEISSGPVFAANQDELKNDEDGRPMAATTMDLEVDGSFLPMAGERDNLMKTRLLSFSEAPAAGDYRTILDGGRNLQPSLSGILHRAALEALPGESDLPGLDQAWWLQRLTGYLHDLPPELPAEPPAPAEPPDPGLAALSARLYRGDDLARGAGIEIMRTTSTFNGVRKTLQSRTEERLAFDGTRWVHGSHTPGADGRLAWCDGREYVAGNTAFLLGWRRPARAFEGAMSPMALGGFEFAKLEDALRGYQATITPEAANRSRVRAVWTADGAPGTEALLTVDDARDVLLDLAWSYGGTVSSRTVFSDFVRVRDAWWPGRMETFDATGRKLSESIMTYRELGGRDLAGLEAEARRELAEAVLFARPLPGADEALERIGAGKGAAEDHLAVLVREVALQRWDLVFRSLDALDGLLPGRPGLDWLRLALESQSRRHQEMKTRAMALAAELVQKGGAEAWVRARYLAEEIAAQGLEALEIVDLLDRLEPIFEAQPEWTGAARMAGLNRVSWLQNAGRAEEADLAEGRLVSRFPGDFGVVQQRAWTLRGQGDFEAAYRLLLDALEQHGPWESWEESGLRGQWIQFLQEEGRLQEALAMMEEWAGRGLEEAFPCDQYLSLLVRTGRPERAAEVIREWIPAALSAPADDVEAPAKLQAALNLMLGQGYMLYTYTVEPHWIPLLTDLAIRLVRDDLRFYLVWQILSHPGVVQHGADRVIRADWLRQLREEMGALGPAAVLRLAPMLAGGEPVVGPETWRELARVARSRMEAAAPAERQAWSDTLVQLLSMHADLRGELLSFLRERFRDAKGDRRAEARDALHRALLGGDWSAVVEPEALALALTTAHALEEADPSGRIVAFLQTVDWMVLGRVRLAGEGWKDQDGLTRSMERSLLLEATAAAHRETARVLTDLEGPLSLQDWIAAEVAFHELRGGGDAAAVAARCSAMLDDPRLAEPGDDPRRVMLRERLVLTLEYLATRDSGAGDLATSLLARIDGALERAPGDTYWRIHRLRLLLALDRVDDMETSLRSWTVQGGPAPAWRRCLGWLLAETGRISEAIAQFEALRDTGELEGGEFAALADWYLVQGRSAERLASSRQRFMALPEYALNELYQRKASSAGVTGIPEVDPETLDILTALLRKAQYPSNYAWQVQSLFQLTGDHRLIGTLAGGLLGHSPAAIYPVFQTLQALLNEVRDEASVDAAVSALDAVRPEAQSPTDRRALDLFRVALERRAAELLNQPGPHGKAALEALERARKEAWQKGERRLMAGFLEGLGMISWDALAKAQRETLQALLDGETPGSEDHLAIAGQLARLWWSYSLQEDAVKTLRRAMDAYLSRRGGVLSSSANGEAETLVGYLEQLGRHRDAEAFLGTVEQRAATVGQRWWARHRSLQVLAAALSVGGTASPGAGSVLYATLRDRLRAELTTQPPQRAWDIVSVLTWVLVIARDQRLGDATADLRGFLEDPLARILEHSVPNRQALIGSLADCLVNLAGPAEGIALLLGFMEDEPAWSASTWEGGWGAHSYRLSRWRQEARLPGDLEARLLALVKVEVRRDLEMRRTLNGNMYHRSYGDFWEEKAGDFAGVAKGLLAEHPDDGSFCEYAASYLDAGLARRVEAMEVLETCRGRGILADGALRTLVAWMMDAARYGDAQSVLTDLLERQPRDLELLAMSLECTCRAGDRKGETGPQLTRAEEALRASGAWGWAAQLRFALSLQRCGDAARAVPLFEAGIDGYLAIRGPMPDGDSSLSTWYQGLAQAQAQNGDVLKAVDAASAAVVAWGRNTTERQAALGALRQVLEAARDLDVVARDLDAQAKASGLENPTVRKALAAVLAERGRDPEALVQLERALEASDGDPEVWDALVELHRRAMRPREAARARLGACRARPVEFSCWAEAASLFADAGETGDAERARTSIVEAAPDEADAHEVLARILEEQGRWMDALGRWRVVVRLREGSPAGFLGVALAALEARVLDEAQDALDHILSRTWPRIFDDVVRKARELKSRVDSR
ncbi:MAG: hypothetical protein FJ098_01900, partial [Deltaproteobacteria bacterium]|nr:hypothetical protein [Deltaproteobacteria bacterium]